MTESEKDLKFQSYILHFYDKDNNTFFLPHLILSKKLDIDVLLTRDLIFVVIV